MSDVEPARRAARRKAIEEMLAAHPGLFTFDDDETEREPGESEAALTGWVFLVRCITVNGDEDHNEHLMVLGNEGLGFTAKLGMIEWATCSERGD